MAGGLVQFGAWLATQVFDVVGSVAGQQGGADDGSGTVDLQVGKLVFHDVPAKMRTELWMSQLQRKSARGASTMGEYRDLLFETLAPDVLSEIEKDTHRTFPGHKMLSSLAGQQAMLNVLRAYALSDPEIGYTQGMNFIAGLLLAYLPGEAEAYVSLSLLMHQRGLREMYLPDMRLLQIRLWQLGKLLPPRLADHLEAHAVLPVLYASSWLLTCFAADFPLHFAGRVMDVLLTGHQAVSPVLKVAVSLVARCERDLLRMTDFEEMVHHLRQEVPRWPRHALQELLTDALSKPWSARQLKVLQEINGAETVMEAVARVNNLVQQPTSDASEVAAMLEAAGSAAASTAASSKDAAAAAAAGSEPARPAPSPRTMARSLSSSFRVRPLPPPPTGRADAVPWDAWQAADLNSVAKQSVVIEASFPDLVDLDPHLSQALSLYQHEGSPPAALGGGAGAAGSASFALRPGAPAGPAPAPEQQQQQQQQQAAGGSLSPSGSAPADMQRKWDAFAQSSTQVLQVAPSPFGAPPPIREAVTFDTAQLGALCGAAAAAEQQLQQQRQPAAAEAGAGAGLAEEADTYGSFQLGAQPSWVPLVEPQQQAQQAQQAAGSSPSKSKPFLGGLFGGRGASASPGRPSPFDGDAAQADSGLIQEVPSSHGSSLAAVLSQLGLSDGGSVRGASEGGGWRPAGSRLGADSQRRLRHSTEDEGFGSWKTAAGSDQHSSRDMGGAASGAHSWHTASERQGSVASAASSERGPAHGGLPPRSASQLSSTASSGLPPAQQPAQPPARVPSARDRAASLQEEHLAGFLSSGKEQASRTADMERAGLPAAGAARPGSA